MNQPIINSRECHKSLSYLVNISKSLTKGHKIHTVGDDTITYPLDPEASKAANLAAFSTETFVNGVAFSEEDLDGGGGGAAGDDSLGAGGAVVWGTTGA